MSPERIPYEAENWQTHVGHVKRYQWATKFIKTTDTVLDVACGIGYASELLAVTGCNYIGIDKPGVPLPEFEREGVQFVEADLDGWFPGFIPDVTLCFETLEHLEDPQRMADILQGVTGRLICVSVPIIETVGKNEFHKHDFTEESLRQMFDYWHVLEEWDQPSESSHVWAFNP